MSIFFPDNEKRHDRLLELSSDTQIFLYDLKDLYKEFVSVIENINDRVARLYQREGLAIPEITTIDILNAGQATREKVEGDTTVSFLNVLVDVGGFLATVSFIAPGVTTLLVSSGVMGAETAATVLGTLLGVELTIGSLAGGVIAGIIVAGVIIGIGLIMDAIEGAILRDKLREGIHKLDQVRANVKLSLDKVGILLSSLKGVKRALESFEQSGIAVNDSIINNLINKTIAPAIEETKKIDMSQVRRELNQLDYERHSWVVEDQIPVDNVSTSKTFIVARMQENSIPFTPEGLKTVSLMSPDTLLPNSNYPVIKSNGYTYWPLSYNDNRYGMAIVAYNHQGELVKVWHKDGARYIVNVNTDPSSNNITLVGQSNRNIILTWKELEMS
ncbi:hypothetical protein [Alkalihalophilus marmarensis]|uniref:hypothetical protein n=1 Tax=Alkalihalophilus marmarensis TaxID=521377 RepID=UPI002DB5C5DC|nr:hypothetical protein [Alkalihalophilus marmarensis]MEC2074424.1 hypothetical protein [Alkalihalophilus marmarensis]